MDYSPHSSDSCGGSLQPDTTLHDLTDVLPGTGSSSDVAVTLMVGGIGSTAVLRFTFVVG